MPFIIQRYLLNNVLRKRHFLYDFTNHFQWFVFNINRAKSQIIGT